MNKDGRGLLADATYPNAIDFRQEVLSFILGLAISDKKKQSFANINIEKLVTPPGGHIF